MYAYPTNVDDELLEKINNLEKVVKYIDLPLQHSNIEMLEKMKRPAFDYREFIENIRKKVRNLLTNRNRYSILPLDENIFGI